MRNHKRLWSEISARSLTLKNGKLFTKDFDKTIYKTGAQMDLNKSGEIYRTRSRRRFRHLVIRLNGK